MSLKIRQNFKIYLRSAHVFSLLFSCKEKGQSDDEAGFRCYLKYYRRNTSKLHDIHKICLYFEFKKYFKEK